MITTYITSEPFILIVNGGDGRMTEYPIGTHIDFDDSVTQIFEYPTEQTLEVAASALPGTVTDNRPEKPEHPDQAANPESGKPAEPGKPDDKGKPPKQNDAEPESQNQNGEPKPKEKPKPKKSNKPKR